MCFIEQKLQSDEHSSKKNRIYFHAIRALFFVTISCTIFFFLCYQYRKNLMHSVLPIKRLQEISWNVQSYTCIQTQYRVRIQLSFKLYNKSAIALPFEWQRYLVALIELPWCALVSLAMYIYIRIYIVLCFSHCLLNNLQALKQPTRWIEEDWIRPVSQCANGTFLGRKPRVTIDFPPSSLHPRYIYIRTQSAAQSSRINK